ncbi:MAG TPA: hypothetical protein VGH53_29575 [Streptosporangiaceae bacterium]|jgi:hypothetical protein
MTSVTLTQIGLVCGGRTQIFEDNWGGEIARLILDPDVIDPDATSGLAASRRMQLRPRALALIAGALLLARVSGEVSHLAHANRAAVSLRAASTVNADRGRVS